MNDLVITAIAGLPAEYQTMLDTIGEAMPAVHRDSENFYKSASQFKSAMLDNTALTPFRTIKQTLAEIGRARMALEEAHIKIAKNRIEIRRRESINPSDTFDAELAQVEIREIEWQNANIENNVRGAVRKLAFQIAQYKSVLSALGRDSFSEADYEHDEVRYHIMTAFKQGWIAANARGGRIDEGNLIYLFDLGIPLAAARAEIQDRFDLEQSLLAEKKIPTHASTLEWLASLAEKFADSPEVFAMARGLTVRDDALLLGGAFEDS